MTVRDAIVLVLLGAAAAGCAVADTGAFVRLQEDMEKLKKETAAARTAASPASTGRADSQDLSSFRKSVADISADNDRIKSDVLASSTRADEAKVELQKEISRLNAKTDEQAQGLQEVRAKAARVEELERRVAALDEKVEKLAAGARTAAPAPSAQVPQDWKSPEEMYDYALGLIKGGEQKKGREILTSFAAKYPDHKLMPNVYYWKGESYYAEKDYENAILSFQDVVDKHPGGDKAPDAMLKQGLSFLGLKDRKNARLLFELIQKKYPKSPAAEKAKQKLSELK